MKSTEIMFIGAILGGVSVIFGAVGAHALKSVLEENQRLSTWDTATKFMFFHALAILFIGLWTRDQPQGKSWHAIFMIIGTLLFCGSLYIIALSANTTLAFLAPIGGIFYILGWTWLAIQLVKKK